MLLLILWAAPLVAQDSFRVATFNMALARKGAGVLVRELERGGTPQIAALAEIVAEVAPDILVVNELDHDIEGRALDGLAAALRAAGAPDYPYRFAGPVNTGVPSGLDLDGDGALRGPGDAFGFGLFPGQYGMAILSRHPLDTAALRSFRLLLWRDLPGARLPVRSDGSPFPSPEAQAAMRLSSKAHWDLPVILPSGRRIALLVSHPTPPVFDDDHDLNGRRNADEIGFWVRYLDGGSFPDDAGVSAPRADLPAIVLGDLNADPRDGDGLRDGIGALLAHPRLQDPGPRSPGGVEAADEGVNRRHRGDPARDTADFNDIGGPGNLRADYVLPDRAFTVRGAGVVWPRSDDPRHRLIGTGRPVSSDHRLVWVDLTLP